MNQTTLSTVFSKAVRGSGCASTSPTQAMNRALAYRCLVSSWTAHSSGASDCPPRISWSRKPCVFQPGCGTQDLNKRGPCHPLHHIRNEPGVVHTETKSRAPELSQPSLFPDLIGTILKRKRGNSGLDFRVMTLTEDQRNEALNVHLESYR